MNAAISKRTLHQNSRERKDVCGAFDFGATRGRIRVLQEKTDIGHGVRRARPATRLWPRRVGENRYGKTNESFARNPEQPRRSRDRRLARHRPRRGARPRRLRRPYRRPGANPRRARGTRRRDPRAAAGGRESRRRWFPATCATMPRSTGWARPCSVAGAASTSSSATPARSAPCRRCIMSTPSNGTTSSASTSPRTGA